MNKHRSNSDFAHGGRVELLVSDRSMTIVLIGHTSNIECFSDYIFQIASYFSPYRYFPYYLCII